jgi:hypothetical protein
LRPRGHVEQDRELLLEVGDLVRHGLEGLLAFHERGARFEVSRLGHRFQAPGRGHGAGADALRGQ